MSWVAVGVAGVGLVGTGVSAGIQANNAPEGPLGKNEIFQQLALQSRFAPLSGDAGLTQLASQAAFGAGAGADSIALDIISRQIAETKTPQAARVFQQRYSELQSLVSSGANPRAIQRKLDTVNSLPARYGVGSTVNIANGRAELGFSDPALQSVVDRARSESAAIQANRLTGQANLSRLAADFPMASATGLDTLTAQVRQSLRGELDENYNQQVENLLQSANTRGFNPFGSIADLEKQRARDLQSLPFTSADRALQMLSGRQGLAQGSIAGINAALSPDATIGILNAMRNQQTPNTGQLALAQINARARANASDAAAQSQGLNNLGGLFSDITGIGIYLDEQRRLGQNTGPGTGGTGGPR